jgi:hypothetical protein
VLVSVVAVLVLVAGVVVALVLSAGGSDVSAAGARPAAATVGGAVSREQTVEDGT